MSKIPEGATHVWTPGSQPHYLRQVCGGGWCIWRESAWYWQGEHVSGPIEVLKTATWNGPEDGLPPVGTVCRVVKKSGEDAPLDTDCTIVAHVMNGSREVAVFTRGKPYEMYAGLALTNCFRPIRTAEQLAAEERDRAIAAIQKASGGDGLPPITYTHAAKLYNAGARMPGEGSKA